jgi:hypothetical protein
MGLKDFFSKKTSGKAATEDRTAALRKKWMQNEKVREWEQNGWLKDEHDDVIAYMLTEWERRNEPVPPPHRVKANVIEEYQKKTGYETLVETGTYLGKMIDAQKKNFKKIMSIEIDKKFHEDAIEKFKAYPYISFYRGDSGKVMADIMKVLDQPAVFWLDAHYNNRSTEKLDKECPIYEELNVIFAQGSNLDHVLLIDDARLFIGKNDYPTIPELTEYILSRRPDYKIEVKDDVIRATKK